MIYVHPKLLSLNWDVQASLKGSLITDILSFAVKTASHKELNFDQNSLYIV